MLTWASLNGRHMREPARLFRHLGVAHPSAMAADVTVKNNLYAIRRMHFEPNGWREADQSTAGRHALRLRSVDTSHGRNRSIRQSIRRPFELSPVVGNSRSPRATSS